MLKRAHQSPVVGKASNVASAARPSVRDLWCRISVEKRISYAYLDSLWFSLYKGRSTKSKVLQWIKKKQIFLRKYIFVPIICWKHWSFLILFHFGGRGKSKINQPCMLLLDSLQKLDPKRLEPQIRRFVRDIYRSEGRNETDEFISKIPLLIPKVPQQRSGEECGVFVLYFLYLFLQTAPDSFFQEGYPSFLNEDWFKLVDLEGFGKEIHRLCMSKDSSEDTKDSSEDSMDIGQLWNIAKQNRSFVVQSALRFWIFVCDWYRFKVTDVAF